MSAAAKRPDPVEAGEASETYLDRKRAGEFLGLSEHWFHKHHNDPEAPPFVKAGRKAWYKKSDLIAFSKKRSLEQKSGEMLTKANTGRKTVMPTFESVRRKFESMGGMSERRNLRGEKALAYALSVLIEQYKAILGEDK